MSEIGDLIVLALALAPVFLFSYLAVRAEMQLWKQTRHIEHRRQEQQWITDGLARMR